MFVYYSGLNESAGAGPLHEVDEFRSGDNSLHQNNEDLQQRQIQQQLQQQQQQQQHPRLPALTPLRFGSSNLPNQQPGSHDGLSPPDEHGQTNFDGVGGADRDGAGSCDGSGNVSAAVADEDGDVQILDSGNGGFWSHPAEGTCEVDFHADNNGPNADDENAAVNSLPLTKAEGLEGEIGGGQVVPFVNHEEEKVRPRLPDTSVLLSFFSCLRRSDMPSFLDASVRNASL